MLSKGGKKELWMLCSFLMLLYYLFRSGYLDHNKFLFLYVLQLWHHSGLHKQSLDFSGLSIFLYFYIYIYKILSIFAKKLW